MWCAQHTLRGYVVGLAVTDVTPGANQESRTENSSTGFTGHATRYDHDPADGPADDPGPPHDPVDGNPPAAHHGTPGAHPAGTPGEPGAGADRDARRRGRRGRNPRAGDPGKRGRF